MVYNAFLNALNANGVTQFSLKPAPFSHYHVAGVALVNMTRVQCDAYVVPHHSDPQTHGTLRRDVMDAGAIAGIEAYDGIVKLFGDEGLQEGGSVVTKSGGGLSSYLTNVVSLGSESFDQETNIAELAIISAMNAAPRYDIDYVVFPPS